MKKIRRSAAILLVSLAALFMTACGNGSDNTDNGTTTQGTAAESSAGEQGRTESETGGVIDGLMDDVERGAEDLTREPESSGRDQESDNGATDESRQKAAPNNE